MARVLEGSKVPATHIRGVAVESGSLFSSSLFRLVKDIGLPPDLIVSRWSDSNEIGVQIIIGSLD
jgi:hypothetical protein